MRLFGYYAIHTFKNQLKKLFKTWVLIFLVVCMAIGAAIGFGVSKLESAGEEPEVTETETAEENKEPSFLEKRGLTKYDMLELAAGGLILVVFFIEAFSADKNGSRIFLPADVNILFASPLKPQTVLTFRLMTQMGVALIASIYMLFQLPNLIFNAGLSPAAAFAAIGGWAFTIILGKLLQVLLYMLSSNDPRFKANLRRGLYVFVGVLLVAFVIYRQKSGADVLSAAVAFFNGKYTRLIPLWGFIKGFVMFAAEGSALGTAACFAAVVLSALALAFLIRRTKADFYEDAMKKSEEISELLEKAKSDKSGRMVFSARKKDRSERIRRDGMRYGKGADVFFFKELYNRFRFAHLGFFTKTSEAYIAAALGVAVLFRFVLKSDGLIPVALVLAGCAFFRSLGDPLAKDTKNDYFLLIPEDIRAKLFWSLAGGAVSCLLDVLPALILAVILLNANLFAALAWIPFIISIDLYATCVGSFIGASVPVAAGKTLKQMVQIMFIYFGLIPDVIIMVSGFVLGRTAGAAIASAVLNVLLAAIFFFLIPVFLEPSSKPAKTK